MNPHPLPKMYFKCHEQRCQQRRLDGGTRCQYHTCQEAGCIRPVRSERQFSPESTRLYCADHACTRRCRVNSTLRACPNRRRFQSTDCEGHAVGCFDCRGRERHMVACEGRYYCDQCYLIKYEPPLSSGASVSSGITSSSVYTRYSC
ncbi:hypothetical protein P170DRAFT_511929 [Aspergillus steynii IBT 23096]|uniref:Uncharacterized protein n=1 Tax=Aspergillus steynii IBT 23096 TaxID=1392250 RepID=A0A2I2G355_9EURO|nr:uncharacterized protein P170DRAFT_511929 [Aspergillus steynii IBT 23096]PLB47302.1 hypothetical protein P170DRAFT_511929 [Aspergillus steynii IBT 23096]